MTAPPPPPFTPPDCNLEGMGFMPLHVQRLQQSDFWALASPAEKVAALNLWMRAWTTVPAASLPADDRLLAKCADMTLADWQGVREMALHGWTLCADGRFYHAVIAATALGVWLKRLDHRAKGAKGNATRFGNDYAADEWDRRRAAAQECLARFDPAASVVATAGPGDGRSPAAGIHSPADSPAGSEVQQGRGRGRGRVKGRGTGKVEQILSSPDDDAPADLDLALEAWRDTASRCGLAQLRGLSEPRRKKLLAILKAHGLDGWREALEAVEASSFLRGTKPGRDGRAWKASFDFLVQPGSFLKVIEGQYADGEAAPYVAGSGDYLAMAARVIEGEMPH